MDHPVPEGYKYGDLALQVGGSLKKWDNNMVLRPAGLRWRGPAATLNYRPVLSSERRLYKITNPQLSKENFTEKDKMAAVPDGCLTPRRTGRLTVGRNITSASIIPVDTHCICGHAVTQLV
jgi:hypothetical protein